jgi:AhpD family alkylhydroperoxidase
MTESEMAHFRAERERLNELVMRYSGRSIKRFFNLDTQVYREGALPSKMKEMMGLVASLVLRCDDCIRYHLVRCHEEGVSSEELEEALAIGLIVGGSIVIPHLRRAFEAWEDFEANPRAKTASTPHNARRPEQGKRSGG